MELVPLPLPPPPAALMAISVNYLDLLVLHSESIEISVRCWEKTCLPPAPVFHPTSFQMCVLVDDILSISTM